jgi:hypothetical protein
VKPPEVHSTTILSVRRNGAVVVAGDYGYERAGSDIVIKLVDDRGCVVVPAHDQGALRLGRDGLGIAHRVGGDVAGCT